MYTIKSSNMASTGVFSFFVSLAIIAGLSQANPNLIRQPIDRNEANPVFSSCLSWRLGVETNNIRDWEHVPKLCEDYVGDYMLGTQYREDSKAVTNAAFCYAKSLNLAGDGKDIWIFDVDETSLSNLPFYAQYGFGADPINYTAFFEWQLKGEAPVLPESLKLYYRLLSLGIKIVFLTGRPEFGRSSTTSNLRQAGYHTWEKLILRDSSQLNYTQVEYKSIERVKLVEGGYRIVGNIGDQWSDLLGLFPGKRTFKLPNPMYHVK